MDICSKYPISPLPPQESAHHLLNTFSLSLSLLLSLPIELENAFLNAVELMWLKANKHSFF